MTPRAAALLAALAERAMHVVTKRELVSRLWNGRAVGDDALTSCVQELRRALGDDPRRPQLIETRHRRGYRLLMPVLPAEAPEERVARPPRLSIVVLPFANLEGDSEQEYFVDGVTDSLTTDLSRMSGMLVIGRNTAFTYKGKSVDVRQIGRELGVRYVLEGSVQRGGNRMRVNVQLVDAESGTHLWAERFDKPVADLLDTQDEIVARLARALDANVVSVEARRAERAPHPDSTDLNF